MLGARPMDASLKLLAEQLHNWTYPFIVSGVRQFMHVPRMDAVMHILH